MWTILICLIIIILHFWAKYKYKEDRQKDEEVPKGTILDIVDDSPALIKGGADEAVVEDIPEDILDYNMDDIITYKEEDGIISGCLNLVNIKINKWIAEDYKKVEVGDDLLEITILPFPKPEYTTTIKSTSSGIFVKKRFISSYHKLTIGETIFSIYREVADLKKIYPNEIVVSTDDFTKATTIKGNKCAGSNWGFEIGWTPGESGTRSMYINIENVDGKFYLILRYDNKVIKLNKKCSFHLLLGDETVITLNAISAPTKVYSSDFEIKYQLSISDLEKLETIDFVKWQITNEEGITIEYGRNVCCIGYTDKTGITQALSYEVFKDFIRDFNKKVRENLPEEKLNDATKEDSKDKGSCFVYLMIDTTNNFHKIGISNHPRYREHTLQSDKPTIELVCAKEYPSRTIAEAIESALHKAYANKRLRGEWFNLDKSDIDIIKRTLT